MTFRTTFVIYVIVIVLAALLYFGFLVASSAADMKQNAAESHKAGLSPLESAAMHSAPSSPSLASGVSPRELRRTSRRRQQERAAKEKAAAAAVSAASPSATTAAVESDVPHTKFPAFSFGFRYEAPSSTSSLKLSSSFVLSPSTLSSLGGENMSHVDLMLRLTRQQHLRDMKNKKRGCDSHSEFLSTQRALKCVAQNSVFLKCASEEWAKETTRRVLVERGGIEESKLPQELAPRAECRPMMRLGAPLDKNNTLAAVALQKLASTFAFEFVGDSVTRGLYASFLKLFSRWVAVPGPRALKRMANQDRRGPVYPSAMVFLPEQQQQQQQQELDLTGKDVFRREVAVAASRMQSPASLPGSSSSVDSCSFSGHGVDLLSDAEISEEETIQCTASLKVPLRQIKLINRSSSSGSSSSSAKEKTAGTTRAAPTHSPFLRAFFRFDALHHLMQSPRVNSEPSLMVPLAQVFTLEQEQEFRRRQKQKVAEAQRQEPPYSRRLYFSPSSLLGIRAPPFMWRAEAVERAVKILYGGKVEEEDGGHSSRSKLTDLARRDDVLTNGHWPKVVVHTNIHIELAVARFVSDAVADGSPRNHTDRKRMAPKGGEDYSDFFARAYGRRFQTQKDGDERKKGDHDDFLNSFEREHITNFLRVQLNHFLHLSSRRNIFLFAIIHTIQDCDALNQPSFTGHAKVFAPVCAQFYIRSFQLFRVRQVLREEILRAFRFGRAQSEQKEKQEEEEEDVVAASAVEGRRKLSEALAFIRRKWNSTKDFFEAWSRQRDLAYHLRNTERFLGHDVEVAARKFIREELLLSQKDGGGGGGGGSAHPPLIVSELEKQRLLDLMSKTVFFSGVDMQRYQHLCNERGTFCDATTDSIHPDAALVEPLERDAVLNAVEAAMENCNSK